MHKAAIAMPNWLSPPKDELTRAINGGAVALAKIAVSKVLVPNARPRTSLGMFSVMAMTPRVAITAPVKM